MLVLPVALVVGTVGVVGILLAVARRLVPDDPARPHHDAANSIFAMIGVLYAVILAFVVIVVWENDRKAHDDLQVEANAVSRIYFTARALPEPQRHELMSLARDYAAVVVSQEWPLMAEGETSAQARRHVAGMRVTAHQLRPSTADQEILMADTLDAINALVDARRERNAALTTPLPPLMWTGLAAGSLITVGFTFLFNRPTYPMQLLMVGSMAAMVTVTLWLIHDLSRPFAGVSTVDPEAFQQILERFREFPPDA